MTEQSGIPEQAPHPVPEWAVDFPNPWQDPSLVERANGNESYLDLLAWARIFIYRAEHFPDNQAFADEAVRRQHIVQAYEQHKGIVPPVDS